MIRTNYAPTLPAQRVAKFVPVIDEAMPAPLFTSQDAFRALQLDPEIERLIMPYINQLARQFPAILPAYMLAIILATDPKTKEKVETLSKAAHPLLYAGVTLFTFVGPAKLGALAKGISARLNSKAVAKFGASLSDGAATIAAADAAGNLDTFQVLLGLTNSLGEVHRFYTGGTPAPSQDWKNYATSFSPNAQSWLGQVFSPIKVCQGAQLLITTTAVDSPFSPLFTITEFKHAWSQLGAFYERIATPTLSPFGDLVTDHIITHPYNEKRKTHFHRGIDIRAKVGTPIYAPAAGQIHLIKTDPGGYGKYLVLKTSDGHSLVFAHLSKYNPSLKQGITSVEKGAFLGNTGSAPKGAHLHFEIRQFRGQNWQGPSMDPDTALAKKIANWRDIFSSVTAPLDFSPALPVVTTPPQAVSTQSIIRNRPRVPTRR